MSPGSFIYPFSEYATPKEELAKRLGYQPDPAASIKEARALLAAAACLSGPGPSTSRSIAWRSRRTDLGRQQLAGAERIGVRVIYRATYIGVRTLARSNFREWRLVFFSNSAIRPRVAGVHIPSLNHARTRR